MTREAATLSRRERRLLELEDKRYAKRDRHRRQQQRRRGLELRSLSIASLIMGIAGVLAFAVVTAPPAPVELNEPAIGSPVQVADGMALGVATAPVTVDLWSDFQCPACGLFTRTIEPSLVSDYVIPGKVRLVYHDLSFLGTESVNAAVAARVAGQTNRFWAFHDYLFANQRGEQQGAFSQARLEAIAIAIGLDLEQFRAGQRDPQIMQQVQQQQALGAQIGVNQTPTLIVGEQRFTGVPRSYSDLAAAIDSALAAAGSR